MTEKITKIRFRDREADNIRDHISQMAGSYVYADPFPLSDEDIIEMTNHTIPMSIWKHIEKVVAFDKRMIHSRNSMTTRIDGFDASVAKLYICDGTSRVHFYESGSRKLEASSEFYKPVAKWVHEVLGRKTMVGEFKRHVSRVFYHCNTPGQVKTVYPALVELLPSRMHESLEKSTRATRWPGGLRKEQVEFTETSKKFDHMVLKLKMVSEAVKTRKQNRFRTEVQ